MRIVILAAGQSKRFKDEGYLIPKPFLKINWRGRTRTMLEHVISTIPLGITDDVTVAIPPGYTEFFPRWVKSFEIEGTAGPAETALEVLNTFEQPDSVLIMDSDILNYTNDLHRLCQLDGYLGVLVNQSSNDSYSYVDKLGIFSEIKEKNRISDWAVQGAYFIHRTIMSRFMMHLALNCDAHKEEPYLSQVFDQMIDNKYSILTTYAPINWGTPYDVINSGALIVEEEKSCT